MNKKLLMGIIAGIGVVALVLGLVLGLNNCTGTTDPTDSSEPTPSGTVEPTDAPTEKPTKAPKPTEGPTEPPAPGGISYYSGMPDYGWYDPDEIYEEYTLYTADEFMAFVELVNGMGVKFKDVTIKLGANFVFNKGDASKWTPDDEELLNWTPIGSKEANYFAGNIDGQGHYISGLYSVRARDNGFILFTQKSTIQNLAIVNSYFANTGGDQAKAQVLGGVVGRGYGVTLKNIYCDAVLEGGGYHTGGIAAFARDTWKQNKLEDAKDVLIDSCVFAGTIKGCVGTNVGGILGGTDGVNVKLITNCLNLGSIESSKANVGGIAGSVSKETVMTNCVNAGKVVSEDSKCDRVALIGNASGSATVKDCYFANIPGAKPFGSGSPASSGVMGVARASMKGGNAPKAMTGLDFEKAWTAYKDGYAIPTAVTKMYDALKKTVEEDAGNGGAVYKNPTGSTDTGKADISWYKEGEKTFTLTTADQLYGLAQLVNDGKTTFKGVTIKLGADIVINKGDADNWNAETTGLRAWKAIGNSSKKHFAGIFDGQGHYISGLYVRADRDSGFMCYAMNATVKNLGIINSYFENYGREHQSGYLSAQVLGSFVGRSYGSTLQNLYSDARLVIAAEAQSFNTGGIAGFAKSNGKEGEVEYGASLVESCVFAGTITTNNEKDELTGGILGGTDGSYATVKNCQNRGQIISKGKNYGGIAGKLDKESVMEDCVNVGNVGNKVGLVGSISSTVEVNDCYYVKTTGGKAYGSGTPKTNKIAALSRDQMKGLEVSAAMPGLDFKAKWTALKDDYPIPTGVKALYAAHKQPIPGGESDGDGAGGESGSTHVPGTPDVSWYEDGKTSFTLTTADQLYGLAQLVNEGNSFQGVTIKLGANIVVNEGDASTWTKDTTGLRAWEPIGLWSSSYFSGKLDGQGNYISGLYSVRGRDNGFMAFTINATIENLAIINSYFENTGTNGSSQVVGAFVGRGYGINLKNLYTNAIVVSSAKDYHTGGVIGFTQSDGKQNEVSFQAATIDSVVFAGSIKSTEGEALERVGGILGGTDKGNVTIKNSLFVGTIDTNDNYVGGIVGAINGGSVVTDCVSAGIINKAADKTAGAIVGRLNGSGSFTVTDCYYTEGLNLELYGAGNSATATGSKKLAVDKMVGLAVKDVMPGLDFTSAWTAQENDYPVPTGVKDMYQAHKKPHTHAWSEAWKYDETGHWHVCGNVGCDEGKKDFAEHVYDANDPKDKDCICGYIREIPDANDGANDGSLSQPSGYIGGDNSWYDPDSNVTEYTITNVDQLFGLVYMVNVQGYTFEGITIKLDTNMVINESDASTWGTTPPEIEWKPIGVNWTKCFKGTIDGQGHYISGLYSKNPGYSTFIAYAQGATVKNLAIINSYFENTSTEKTKGEILSTFTGKGKGVHLRNLYSDAILVGGTQQIGGIASYIEGAGNGQRDGKVENCVFAGTINGGSLEKVGGILGSDNNKGNRTVIRNCLFIGTLTSQAEKVGGIVGMAQEYCVIDNCVSAGKVTVTGNNASYTDANVVGFLSGDNAEITNCYYPEGTNLVGNENSKTYKSDSSEAQTDAKMKGRQTATTMANLTFGEKGWTALPGDYPVPTSMKIMVETLRKHSADAAAPVINTQPTMDNLTVHAESMDGGDLSYQWYMSSDGTNFSSIDGANGASHTHDTTLTGNTWYKCEVTNTNENTSGAQNAKLFSDPVKVHEHVFDTTMSNSADGHWYKCTVTDCDVPVESLPTYAEHIYTGGIDGNDDTCNVAECSYKRHLHDWSSTWTRNDTHGWHECGNSGCYVSEAEGKDRYHAHAFNTSTGEAVCDTCGYKREVSYYSGKPDVTWYNDAETEFVLTHADQFYGLINLSNSQGKTFANKTIKLAVNVVIIDGDARTWGENAPAEEGKYWTPLGSAWGNCFKGTLDGQNHYVSGLYSVQSSNNALIYTSQNAEIKNLAIVNSYFENEGGEVLSTFVGKGRGLYLENLYSDAILVGGTQQIGGIASYIEGEASPNSDRNGYAKKCVFAGTILDSTSQYIGGILGSDNNSGTLIENCLFSGTINVKTSSYLGGIVGMAKEDAVIQDCLSAGTVEGSNASGTGNAIVGWTKKNTKQGNVTIDDCYYVSDWLTKINGGNSGDVTFVITDVDDITAANAKGTNALTNMPLLQGWITRADDYPVPISAELLERIPVNADAPVIRMQPGHFGYNAVTDTVTPLEITAESPDGGDISYQWYSNDSLSNTGGTPITGAIQATYKPDLTGMEAGDAQYFYCVVTNKNDNMTGVQVVTSVTDPVCVHIHEVDTSSYAGHNATQHWNACTVNGCDVALNHKDHDAGTDKTCATCGFLKANYYEGGSDTIWYTRNPNATEYVLTTPEELKGLAEIVNAGTDNFKGQTIKLGANMVFNTSNATDWTISTTGLHTWIPIGAKNKVFSGQFNGQNYFISGIYGGVSNNNGLFGYTEGATIENLAVINSFFATNASNGQFLSSIVARAYDGILRNLYSDAILFSNNSDWYTGGIAACARTTTAGRGTIDRCVFAGTIQTANSTKVGSYVGGIVAGADGDDQYCSVTNCLFIGTINSNDMFVGGILGNSGAGTAASGGAGEVSNCVSAGTITHTSTDYETNCVGAVVGRAINTNDTHVITNCFFSEDIGLELLGKQNATNVQVDTTGSSKLSVAQMKGDAAATNMPALFADQTPAWQVVTGGYPIPVGVVIPN